MKSELLWLFFDRSIGNRHEAAEIKVSATYLWCDLKLRLSDELPIKTM